MPSAKFGKVPFGKVSFAQPAFFAKPIGKAAGAFDYLLGPGFATFPFGAIGFGKFPFWGI